MHTLSLLVPQAMVESLSDALMFELDALSVTVEDAEAGADTEQALFGEPGMPPPANGWQCSRVSALFAEAAAAHSAADALVTDLGSQGMQVLGVQTVPDEDWVRLTQSQFDPICVLDHFWVVPTWHNIPQDAQRVLRLDPGLAFGSGTHPTTLMCLRWIARHADDAIHARRVLDYGCGSGILAIGAALHKAATVDAVDIDPAAVDATQANAVRNGVAVQAGLPDMVDQPDTRYDVVLANILATPLKLLAPLLSRLVSDGGRLVLAGVLTRQADELRAAYAPWLDLRVADEVDGWVLLTAQR